MTNVEFYMPSEEEKKKIQECCFKCIDVMHDLDMQQKACCLGMLMDGFEQVTGKKIGMIFGKKPI